MHWGWKCPAPLSSCVLGWAMRRKARRLALAEGPLLFFGVVSCWQILTFCEGFLEMTSFQCIGGGSVPPPFSCQTLGRAVHRKGRCIERRVAWPWQRLECSFCLVLGASCVGKYVAGVKQGWQCSVVLAVWRRYELRLLKLLDFFHLQTHLLISMPRSSDNMGSKVG